ncbi:Pentatricopeptide repeat-containing protein, chloroplastic, partial [Cucurbita argyrosperma subsp. sororia]
MAEVTKLMEKKGLQETHAQSKRIYAFLEELRDEIKVAGYVPNTSLIHDVEDDVQEQLLNSHSEKLAIAFGLLNTSPDTMIHVQKNLQVWRLIQPSIRLCLLPLIPLLDTFMLL